MFLSASQGALYVHVVMLALEQYATRANCAGHWGVLLTTSNETGVCAPVDAPRPKIGRESGLGRRERSGITARAQVDGNMG
jgi:hypothetical protein